MSWRHENQTVAPTYGATKYQALAYGATKYQASQDSKVVPAYGTTKYQAPPDSKVAPTYGAIVAILALAYGVINTIDYDTSLIPVPQLLWLNAILTANTNFSWH